MKQDLRNVHSNIAKMDNKRFLVKVQNFEIHQRLVRIIENKDVPYVDYMSRLLDSKLQPILSQLNKFSGVPNSGYTS